MTKRKPGALDDESPPLRDSNNIDENGAHGGQHEVRVSSSGKSPNKPARRRPFADCTNVLSNDPKRGQVGEELAAKRKREAERKRQYRARKKAELENSLPMSVRESSMTNVAGCTVEEAALRNHLNATPFTLHTGPTAVSVVTNPTLGLGSNTTTPSWCSQISTPVSNPAAEAMRDTLVNPTLGSGSIVDLCTRNEQSGKENQAVEMHGNKGIKRQKKGIFGESNHDTSQPSQLSVLTGNIKEARMANSTKRTLHDITNIEAAGNLNGDEDENWLHRNDNWQPSTLILRRDGGN